MNAGTNLITKLLDKTSRPTESSFGFVLESPAVPEARLFVPSEVEFYKERDVAWCGKSAAWRIESARRARHGKRCGRPHRPSLPGRTPSAGRATSKTCAGGRTPRVLQDLLCPVISISECGDVDASEVKRLDASISARFHRGRCRA